LLIKNEFIQGENNNTFKTINPSTGKAIYNVAKAFPSGVDYAIDTAVNAFYNPTWSKLPVCERGLLLLKLADLIEKDQDELTAIETLDNDKTFMYAKFFDVKETAFASGALEDGQTKSMGKPLKLKRTFSVTHGMSHWEWWDHSLEFPSFDACLKMWTNSCL